MKITMKTSKTMKEFFDDFIIAKKAARIGRQNN